MPQRPRVVAENGLFDFLGFGLVADGLLDSWICGLLRMSEVVAGLCVVVFIVLVCVLVCLVIDEVVVANGCGQTSTDRSCLRNWETTKL